MESTANRAIAIVGLGAVLPDAANVPAFWNNVKTGRYCISEVSPERWDPALYFDEDHSAPDKTYSKIGGWVRDFEWDPMKWRMPIPPRVAEAMDVAQHWAIACTREALEDYGYPKAPLDPDRMAVILGNAMAGEKHYFTALRVYFPEYATQLSEASSFAALPSGLRAKINEEMHDRITQRIPDITEDSMPGELANCIAGRIANIFNFHGPNYVVDAACASAMAAFSAAIEGLIAGDYDTVITGGIDRNMGASTFVKFCKIGALSATGTRPYAEGADGFVMGEGAAIFLLKRLVDAERDGDKIYAVIRGVGGASDGKGKGITAPNPVGQKLAIERGWKKAGLSPATATMMEGHGTSTKVGDVVEVQSMIAVLGETNLAQGSVALGSVKSNIGHLKGAAGAAGMLKAALALHEKVLPPTVNCARKNPDIDFAHSPLYVNTELRPWDVPKDTPRRCGASAFGFGGTNFHVVLEEFIPHRLTGNGKRQVLVSEVPNTISAATVAYAEPAAVSSPSATASAKAPLRGALVLGASTEAELVSRLSEVQKQAAAGNAPAPATPAESDLRAPERIAIDYADAAELAAKSAAALKAFQANQPMMWKALRAQGIFRGKGPAPKVAFLYTGQGSQYVNMLRTLGAAEPIVAETFAEADRIMTPLVGKPLSEFIFADPSDAAAVAKAEDDLRQTAITQPAVIATDIAMTRLLAGYGIEPDMAMGHSVGEYGALVASGALPFEDALEAVSARGREMTRVSMADNGKMAAVFAPIAEVERMLKSIKGYAVIANVNSNSQSVIGGATDAVAQAVAMFLKAGFNVVELPVSHAFHTSIVAPASEPLREMLQRLRLQTPRIPIIANVTGEFYPISQDTVPKMIDTLAQQVAAPVQFVKGLQTLYDAGARVFVEMGPKKALQGFAEDVLGGKGDVLSLFTNHPKVADPTAFNQALCGLYAFGFGCKAAQEKPVVTEAVAKPAAKLFDTAAREVTTATPQVPAREPAIIEKPVLAAPVSVPSPVPVSGNGERYSELGRYFAEVLERGWNLYRAPGTQPKDRPVAITGAALGLPGTDHVFDDANIGRLLRGEQFIRQVPQSLRSAMLEKHVTRLVKSDNGGPTFETITDVRDVLKLAGRAGKFDLVKEFGVSEERYAALDRMTSLAIGAGLDALRDAGIPLVMRYKTTSKGTQLPDRWGLPDTLRDETGVVFASAFPGYDAYADEMARYYTDKSYRDQIDGLRELRARIANYGHASVATDIDRMISQLQKALDEAPYVLDRRFLFRVLSMGHSQFAEFIGARGPNTQVNAACASTTQAVSLAEDWIRAGRCRRVIVLSADDITSDNLIHWFGAGFLASGAAATDEIVEQAALPFDRRRHGMIIGMGAAALVVEEPEVARERGIQPIAEVLAAVTANSAFHGTRLDVQHIGQVMEQLLVQAEHRAGISRREIAPRTVFVSHETYTPARGGSASAEIHALRKVFGEAADQIVIANTKGFTGHAMAAGVEDVLAVKALETGCVPPVANFKEIDPELGALNLSKGGNYPVEFALRLGAGFGSQISMTLLHWIAMPGGVHRKPDALGYSSRIVEPGKWQAWLKSISGQSSPNLEVVNRTLRVRDPRVQTRFTAPVETARPGPNQPVPASVTPEPIPAPVAKLAPVSAVTVAAASPIVPPAPNKPATVSAPFAPAVVSPMVITATPPVPHDDVKERVLSLVAEKTGYPTDMLDLDLDLEADLGVDTVKQAEVFAAIRESYGIPRDDSIRLREFPTPAHVIKFVYQRRPDLASQPAAVAAPQHTGAPTAEPHTEIPAITPKPSSAAASPAEGDAVKQRILELTVEKTGYPRDMLDLDLDLEADLGVDTVKQAEMFAAIREIYNIPRDENRRLRDYPTLAHVIRFVYEQRPNLKTAVAQTPEPQVAVAAPAPQPTPTSAVHIEIAAQPPTTSTSAGDPVKERILDLAVDKTGYPRDMLDLDLDLEADLGVDTVKQAEMFAAIREIYNIPRDENRKLRDYPTLAHVIRFVYEQRPDLAGTAKPAAVKAEGAPTKTSQPAVPFTLSAEVAIAAVNIESITQTVLAIVAEKTGYPREMLDLDLDLEADLGVDTVKQAEMFAAVRAAYNIPRDENLKLRDFPTLNHVIQFALDRQPKAAAKPAPTGQVATAGEKVEVSPPAAKRFRGPIVGFEATERVPRRVPVPNLRPPLNLCKPTGVTLGPGTRVFIMPDRGGIANALVERLHSMAVETCLLDESLNGDALTDFVKQWSAKAPVQGVYWLRALDYEGDLDKLTIDTWREALRVRVKSLYTAMRALYQQVGSAGTFLITATHFGGHHGYDENGAVAPLGGAVTGFAKTYKRERSEALVKAVDFEAGLNSSEIARLLIEETLHDPGAVEIGHKGGLRWTIGLKEAPVADGQPGMALDENSVFVVTGAAGSIVSAVTADLATASGGTFYLIDVVPQPDPKNPDLARFVTDKDGLKRDIFARIQARGERATPALVEKELAALERACAAQNAIDAVHVAGGKAHYFSVNLTDPEAVTRAIEEVRRESGHIDVLLHAAGLERSHFLPDKDPREFDLVFDVKSDGWFNLLHAIGDMPLRATVAFSSVAGRFGNAGQSDYSAANDLLCKIASSFRTARPQTRAIAIDWTAWGGIGMATRGSIPKMMEMAGISMLTPEAGVPWIRRELTAGGTREEVVVAERLGVLLDEWDETGGLDVHALEAAVAQLPARGPMLGKVTGMTLGRGLTMETTLDPSSQPFLYDHRIDGTPVLPGVMGIEAFAEAAVCIHPGWYVEAIEEVNFFAPFKFYRDEPRTLLVEAVISPQAENLIADCRLIGRRTLPNQKQPQETLHFTARVRVTKRPPEALTGAELRLSAESIVDAARVYQIYFHGPAYQVIDRAWRDGDRVIGQMAQNLPSNHHPADQQVLAAPRLIELCFQTAGLWEIGVHNRMGLPLRVELVSWSRAPESAEGPLFAIVTPDEKHSSFDAEVVDAHGNRYLRLRGYRTAALPQSVDGTALQALHAVTA
jgi:acyl transferase domain-containing protein/NAD(P)-dependent dehydrogenase (short-subunit alcohol dehydrogenase family)/acyl carrier protein